MANKKNVQSMTPEELAAYVEENESSRSRAPASDENRKNPKCSPGLEPGIQFQISELSTN